jgi:hypothetical protein
MQFLDSMGMISMVDVKSVEKFVIQCVTPHNEAVDSKFLIVLKSGKHIII